MAMPTPSQCEISFLVHSKNYTWHTNIPERNILVKFSPTLQVKENSQRTISSYNNDIINTQLVFICQ